MRRRLIHNAARDSQCTCECRVLELSDGAPALTHPCSAACVGRRHANAGVVASQMHCPALALNHHLSVVSHYSSISTSPGRLAPAAGFADAAIARRSWSAAHSLIRVRVPFLPVDAEATERNAMITVAAHCTQDMLISAHYSNDSQGVEGFQGTTACITLPFLEGVLVKESSPPILSSQVNWSS